MSDWVSVKDRMPPGTYLEKFLDYRYSVTVLATDGIVILTALAQYWTDNECPTQWKLTGPDSYDFNNVTHWQPLPELPS